jgi:ABC-type Mn2+/Zn2+ transport system ATPase subunit
LLILDEPAQGVDFSGQLEEAVEEPCRHPSAAIVVVYGNVHDVPRVGVAGDDQVGDERLVSVCVERAEAD